MIEHPEWITPATITDTFEPVLRNCMIEIMTPERFVRTGLVAQVSEDETGILWRKLWGYRGVTIGSWTAVEVVERHGRGRRLAQALLPARPLGMRTPAKPLPGPTA